MRCPHCDIGIHESWLRTKAFDLIGLSWIAWYQSCPECKQPIVKLHAQADQSGKLGGVVIHQFLAYPQKAVPRPLPPEVPEPYRQDFQEAVAVLPLSPKASAALSRRTLQAVLRDKASTTKRDLNDQIDEVIASGKLPSHISGELHAVRNIGNFAAHLMKSQVTGAIVDVEPGEAEWNLDVLESVFDFYFVEPAKSAQRKAELNQKLAEAGKPLIP